MIAGILRNPWGRLRGDMTLDELCATRPDIRMDTLEHHKQHWQGNYVTCGCRNSGCVGDDRRHGHGNNFYGSAITWAMRIQLRSLRQEQKQKSDTIGHLKSDSVK